MYLYCTNCHLPPNARPQLPSREQCLTVQSLQHILIKDLKHEQLFYLSNSGQIKASVPQREGLKNHVMGRKHTFRPQSRFYDVNIHSLIKIHEHNINI